MNSADENERLQKQYDEIATLAGGLAHEIRNPLSTISMNLELLFEDMEEIEHPAAHRVVRKLGTIQNECGNLEAILEAFLQFAKAGELHLESSDVGELIRLFLDFYKPEADKAAIEIRSRFPTDLPFVKLDQRLFRQALVNLVRNAQQAMPSGGLLELQAHVEGTEVIIEIIDTGCGMAPSALEKMFEVFFSTKPTGNGLGLPTVRKIVESHNGTIRCESELGRGTKFTLRFPSTDS